MSKNETTFVISDGVVELEEYMLNKVFDLKTKLDIALKKIVNLKYNFQAYDNKDNTKSVNATMESKQYCEGIEDEIISLKKYIEKSNKQNEEQENGLKDEFLKLKE